MSVEAKTETKIKTSAKVLFMTKIIVTNRFL